MWGKTVEYNEDEPSFYTYTNVISSLIQSLRLDIKDAFSDQCKLNEINISLLPCSQQDAKTRILNVLNSISNISVTPDQTCPRISIRENQPSTPLRTILETCLRAIATIEPSIAEIIDDILFLVGNIGVDTLKKYPSAKVVSLTCNNRFYNGSQLSWNVLEHWMGRNAPVEEKGNQPVVTLGDKYTLAKSINCFSKEYNSAQEFCLEILTRLAQPPSIEEQDVNIISNYYQNLELRLKHALLLDRKLTKYKQIEIARLFYALCDFDIADKLQLLNDPLEFEEKEEIEEKTKGTEKKEDKPDEVQITGGHQFLVALTKGMRPLNQRIRALQLPIESLQRHSTKCLKDLETKHEYNQHNPLVIKLNNIAKTQITSLRTDDLHFSSLTTETNTVSNGWKFVVSFPSGSVSSEFHALTPSAIKIFQVQKYRSKGSLYDELQLIFLPDNKPIVDKLVTKLESMKISTETDNTHLSHTLTIKLTLIQNDRKINCLDIINIIAEIEPRIREIMLDVLMLVDVGLYHDHLKNLIDSKTTATRLIPVFVTIHHILLIENHLCSWKYFRYIIKLELEKPKPSAHEADDRSMSKYYENLEWLLKQAFKSNYRYLVIQLFNKLCDNLLNIPDSMNLDCPKEDCLISFARKFRELDNRIKTLEQIREQQETLGHEIVATLAEDRAERPSYSVAKKLCIFGLQAVGSGTLDALNIDLSEPQNMHVIL